MGSVLQQAFTATCVPALRPLPEQVELLLESLSAPPRLGAHLRAVHDTAAQLTEWVTRQYPDVGFDCAAVLFGAATHDIGKIVHPSELSEPGSAHEQAGFELLLAHGIDERLARFAGTHGSWSTASALEDLLVTLADKVWKGKRIRDLEQLVVGPLIAESGCDPWAVFLALDDELERIAAAADQRLAFQASFPIRG